MKNYKEYTITVILPIYKGETTVIKTLESLIAQSKKFDELLVINDASPDNSKEKVEKYLAGKVEYRMIDNKKNIGLAGSYNEGLAQAKGDLIVTLHQDVILLPGALEKLILPFNDIKVVASGHKVIFPYEFWGKYNFWQKCFFARFIGGESGGLNGQFDCFRKDALRKIGLFDGSRFRSAGEDGDIIYRLSKIGEIVNTEAKVIHLQNMSPDFNHKDIIFKQKQHSEAQGALLALGRTRGLINIAKAFFREIMLLCLIVPYLNILAVGTILVYSFYYTKMVYLKEWRNPRILILPIFNICLLFVSFAYSLKGFIYGKQKI